MGGNAVKKKEMPEISGSISERSAAAKLTPKDRLVLDYILKNPEEIYNLIVRKLNQQGFDIKSKYEGVKEFIAR